MKKDTHKRTPFITPEGYFDYFPGRMKDLIQDGERTVRVRKLNRVPLSWAVAAAVVGLAMLSIPLYRLFLPSTASDSYSEVALLEEAGIFHNEYELAPYLEENETDEEDAFVSHTIDYLAMSDVEMDIIFE